MLTVAAVTKALFEGPEAVIALCAPVSSRALAGQITRIDRMLARPIGVRRCASARERARRVRSTLAGELARRGGAK